ncbi:MAG: hypothetical protein O3B24_02010 [Verrucomicrobia bacterium]|nr:hypothetical protein [Verrucomicrobiota bacterium]
MIRDVAILKTVQEICARDRRFKPEAYLFVLDALDFTTKLLQKSAKTGRERHVGGRELLEGLRHFSLQEFGPMALRVLNTWGLRRTEDVGDVIFNLVESGKLRKTETDSRADFAAVFDFNDAFAVPFLPASHPEAGQPKCRTGRGGSDGNKRKSNPGEPAS